MANSSKAAMMQLVGDTSDSAATQERWQLTPSPFRLPGSTQTGGQCSQSAGTQDRTCSIEILSQSPLQAARTWLLSRGGCASCCRCQGKSRQGWPRRAKSCKLARQPRLIRIATHTAEPRRVRAAECFPKELESHCCSEPYRCGSVAEPIRCNA